MTSPKIKPKKPRKPSKPLQKRSKKDLLSAQTQPSSLRAGRFGLKEGSNSLLEIWAARDHLQRVVRSFFHSRKYLEIETPIAVISPGTEVHLSYFATDWQDHQNKSHQLYLRSSPELHLKQAVAAGVPRAFHLARCFRNSGEMSAWHHPEFTMLEWYEEKISYEGLINQTEELIREATKQVHSFAKRKKMTLGEVSLPKKFARLTLKQAFREFAGLDLIDDDPDLAAKAIAKGFHSVRSEDDFETAFFKILLDQIEPGLAKLGGAVLMDYPASQAALAVATKGVAHRFEFYIALPNGREVVELCNGFEELLGEKENRNRIDEAAALRIKAGHIPVPKDPDFFAALNIGLNPCCGNALGFDRLLALALGESSLDRVIPFRNAAAWFQSPKK